MEDDRNYLELRLQMLIIKDRLSAQPGNIATTKSVCNLPGYPSMYL